MNCQDALDLLYEIIDKEATQIDTKQVQMHLNKCRDCFQKYELESSIQEFINSRTKPEPQSAKLDHLKSKVLARLDEEDSNSTRSQRSVFRFTLMSVAAAAVLVIMIGAAGLVSDFIRHNGEYIPLEEIHWAAEENSAELAPSDNGQSAQELLNTRYGYQLNSVVADYVLVGGSGKEILDLDGIHFVYTKDGATISVFILPADQFSLPVDLLETKTMQNGIEYYDHQCAGCRMVYHVVGSSMVITASTDHTFDLLHFVPELSPV